MQTDFQLGEWLVRPRRDCIERDGEVVHVTPKAMAVLERLARSAGEVVTREELFDSVWPGSAVTDDALTQCIVELRKALGDSAREPRFVETIPKVGFRLLPAVIPLAPPETPVSAAPFGSAWKPATQMVFVVVSVALLGLVFIWYLSAARPVEQPVDAGAAPSLAVLPFADISAAQDQAWYADGLTEELTNRLAQLEGLRVSSRTAAYQFQNSGMDLAAFAAAQGIGHVLEGSVRADGDQLRITAQLIDARSGYHAWSRQFDRSRTDIFEIQEEIAQEVADALSVELQVGQLGNMPGGTESVQAYELLMRSKVPQWEATPESMVEAIDLAKQAIAVDPHYAYAWWRLAGLYVNANSIIREAEGTDWMSLARDALDRALSIEPDLPGAKFMAVTIGYVSWDWAGVEETMDRGAGLALSTDFDLLFGWTGFLHRVGRVREALPIIERMNRINAYSPGATRAMGWAYAINGRMGDGLNWAEQAFERDGFKAWAAQSGLLIALWSNDHEVISKWLRRAEQHAPESRALFQAMEATLDDRLAALAWLRNTFEETQEHDFQIPFWAAWHGDPELALMAMRRLPVPWAFWGPEMRDVRRLPGFKDLLRQVGLEAYFREYGWNDFCRPLGEADFECE